MHMVYIIFSGVGGGDEIGSSLTLVLKLKDLLKFMISRIRFQH